jgi:anthranilate phosphoribosyltransferase
MNQKKLEEILKKKGIGPLGSKSLLMEELDEVFSLFKKEDVSLVTKATMLTALLALEPNKHEASWIQKVKHEPEQFLPKELVGFINSTNEPFLNIIKKIIDHKDLNEEECKEAMSFFFYPQTAPYFKGPFLEAERLKRETFTENKIFFESLWKKAKRQRINTPVLIDICDSYDGSNRTRNYALFTACLLAAAGFPCLVHGVDKVAPKQGITSHQILLKANKNPLSELEKASTDLTDPLIGWAYIDQSIFFAELYAMKTIRKEMVKRPFLATFEKLLQPVQSSEGNYIVTGYTHPHYREELVNQLKEQGECKQALILKGMEGSTHISGSRDTVCVHFDGKEIHNSSVHPSLFGLEAQEEKQDKTITAEVSLKEGLATLSGEHNDARANILYLACLIVTKFNLMPANKALPILTQTIDSGKALQHWEKGAI